MAAAPTLSIVVPCYNEQEGVRACHERLTKVLRELGESYEIL
jgi:glycosyltransferase involved in cell wall biosynthesis